LRGFCSDTRDLTSVRAAGDLATPALFNEPWHKFLECGGGDDCLRERDEPLYQVIPSLRVQLRERIVEQQEWGVTSSIGKKFNLGEEEREEKASLLPPRRNGGEVAPVCVKRQIVPVWADECVALIPLALCRLLEGLTKAVCGLSYTFAKLMVFPRQVVNGEPSLFWRNLGVSGAKRF
jgi:hypothetical protein